MGVAGELAPYVKYPRACPLLKTAGPFHNLRGMARSRRVGAAHTQARALIHRKARHKLSAAASLSMQAV